MGFSKKSNRPVIVFDMDGTLVNIHNEIHPKDIALLRDTNSPAIFVPATGRSLGAVRSSLQYFGICDGEPLSFDLILQNGSLLYTTGEKKEYFIPFAKEEQKALISLCQNNRYIPFLLFTECDILFLNHTEYSQAESDRFSFDVKQFDAKTPELALSKIMSLSEDPSELDALLSLSKEIDVEKTLSMPTILEFSPKGVNKGNGLTKLAEINGWDKENIFCAGDGENDLEMFAMFPNSFAPQTSPANIQARAARVIDTLSDGLLTPILEAINGD